MVHLGKAYFHESELRYIILFVTGFCTEGRES